jgi:hypothetical protein
MHTPGTMYSVLLVPQNTGSTCDDMTVDFANVDLLNVRTHSAQNDGGVPGARPVRDRLRNARSTMC